MKSKSTSLTLLFAILAGVQALGAPKKQRPQHLEKASVADFKRIDEERTKIQEEQAKAQEELRKNIEITVKKYSSTGSREDALWNMLHPDNRRWRGFSLADLKIILDSGVALNFQRQKDDRRKETETPLELLIDNDTIWPSYQAVSQSPSYESDKLEAVKLLLARGANPNVLDSRGDSAVVYAITHVRGLQSKKIANDIFDEVLKHADVGELSVGHGDSGILSTPLAVAVGLHYPSIVEKLLALKVRTDKVRPQDEPLLYQLVDQFSHRSEPGVTAMIAEMLLKAGCPVNETGKETYGRTWTALTVLAEHGSHYFIPEEQKRLWALFLAYRGDVEFRDADDLPLIVRAAASNNVTAVEALIRAGADRQAKFYGKTAAQLTQADIEQLRAQPTYGLEAEHNQEGKLKIKFEILNLLNGK